jgi:hypothetical protein
MKTIRIPFEQCTDAVLPKQFQSFFAENERLYKIAEAEAYDQCGWGEKRPSSGGVSASIQVDAESVDLLTSVDNVGEDVEVSLWCKLADRMNHPDLQETCREIYDWWLNATDAEREATQWYAFESN